MGRRYGCLHGELLQHAEQQLGYIGATFTQGRQGDAKSSERVCEFCGEASGGDQRSETALREGNDTRGLGSALAEEAEESCLGGLGEALRRGKVEHSGGGEGFRGVLWRILGCVLGIDSDICFGVSEFAEGVLGARRELMEDVSCGSVAATAFSSQKSCAEVGSDTSNLVAEMGDGGAGTCEPQRGGERGDLFAEGG